MPGIEYRSLEVRQERHARQLEMIPQGPFPSLQRLLAEQGIGAREENMVADGSIRCRFPALGSVFIPMGKHEENIRRRNEFAAQKGAGKKHRQQRHQQRAVKQALTQSQPLVFHCFHVMARCRRRWR